MSAINNASFNFRTTMDLKMEALKVIESYGFTPSQVFNLFLTEIANTKSVPVNLSYLKPNAVTLRSMQDAENDELEVIYLADGESVAEGLLKTISK